ncbi:aldehyde dehydrogenase family protein [Bdellovibrio sp. qaytius]|nr:aldehyde dehydrogenase family protein [Bdellovibrio sp. qaytius]
MISKTFLELKSRALHNKSLDISSRIANLKKLLTWIEKNDAEIKKALHLDFQKSEFETQTSEIGIVKSEIKYFIKNLKCWAKPKCVQTPLTLFGHISKIHYEPKGVVLIIAPWNYPFQLTINPLIPAIAAGNTVVIKPSELTPHTSKLIHQMVTEVFSNNEVVCELGGREKTEELLGYDFDHVFFTGSTQVGRIIAEACAKKLTPYTLELGGKSPTIIDETADIDDAAEKVYWGKFLNRGQTCVAPDYVLIHRSKKDAFIKKFNELEKANVETPTGFVNTQNQQRVTKLGGNGTDFHTTRCELIDSPALDSEIMKQEIFGPVAPVIAFDILDDAYKIMALNPHPLALYIFSKSKNNIQDILNKTQSGGVAINNVIVHLANHYLPFGGIRTSGIGTYHGHFGFLEFSHRRSVIEQKFLFKTMRLIFPPYTDFKKKLLAKL